GGVLPSQPPYLCIRSLTSPVVSILILPPGAAPTLVSLEEHYKATAAGELSQPEISLERGNPTSRAIATSLDVNEKLEPNKPVMNGVSAVAAGKRKMSLPNGNRVLKNAR
ncbi:MAG: hypothetical protein Q9192_006391, partial [Flavoplaca navasiana]